MFRSPSLRRSRGYTLVEIMVVLAIMAALSLVAVPWFLRISQRNALKSAARELAITLAGARMTAVKLNAPVNIVIAAVTPPLQFQIVEPVPPAPTPTKRPSTPLEIPQNAAFLVETPRAAGGVVTFGGDGRLQSFPPLTPAVYILEGPTNANVNARNQVRVQAEASGKISVVTPVDWK
jgi:prepilin-type N-terminal cleavage/methylation domain-containing protein